MDRVSNFRSFCQNFVNDLRYPLSQIVFSYLQVTTTCHVSGRPLSDTESSRIYTILSASSVTDLQWTVFTPLLLPRPGRKLQIGS